MQAQVNSSLHYHMCKMHQDILEGVRLSNNTPSHNAFHKASQLKKIREYLLNITLIIQHIDIVRSGYKNSKNIADYTHRLMHNLFKWVLHISTLTESISLLYHIYLFVTKDNYMDYSYCISKEISPPCRVPCDEKHRYITLSNTTICLHKSLHILEGHYNTTCDLSDFKEKLQESVMYNTYWMTLLSVISCFTFMLKNVTFVIYKTISSYRKSVSKDSVIINTLTKTPFLAVIMKLEQHINTTIDNRYTNLIIEILSHLSPETIFPLNKSLNKILTENTTISQELTNLRRMLATLSIIERSPPNGISLTILFLDILECLLHYITTSSICKKSTLLFIVLGYYTCVVSSTMHFIVNKDITEDASLDIYKEPHILYSEYRGIESFSSKDQKSLISKAITEISYDPTLIEDEAFPLSKLLSLSKTLDRKMYNLLEVMIRLKK